MGSQPFHESRVARSVASAGLLLLQASLLAGAASAWWAARSNTLFNNPRWISGKDSGKFVFYSYNFLFHPLDEGCVNLSRDMGFQQLLWADPDGPDRRLTRLQAEAHVPFGGYLWILLRQEGLRGFGCRLSRNGDYPSGFYLFDEQGEVRAYAPFAENAPSLDDRWKKIDLRSVGEEWVLRVDGVEFGRAPEPPWETGRFGFRGSGNPHAAVLVKNVRMTFRNPQAPGSSWTEQQKFKPRHTARRVFNYAFAFAVIALGLRRWRERIFAGFLLPESRESFVWSSNLAFAALLLPLALWPPDASGIGFLVAVAAGEGISTLLVAFFRRKGAPAAYEPARLAGFLYAAVFLAVAVLALVLNGEALARYSAVRAHPLAAYPEDAFLLYPAQAGSSSRFEEPGPIHVAPGKPFLAEACAYREQIISAEFLMPSNATLDIVFQQQSFRTRGDPAGELLPLQRRLVRLTTRKDVPWGVATGTGLRAAPFHPLRGEVLAGKMNHVEIRSGAAGLAINLNGEETRLAGFPSLGFGETGFLAYEQPVTLRGIWIEPAAERAVRDFIFPWLGVALPLALGLALWGLTRQSPGASVWRALGVEWAALYPLAFYAAAALYLGRDTLSHLGRDRVAWLDLALLGSAVAHLVPLALWGGPRPHLRFALGVLAVLVLGSVLGWDLLPQSSWVRLRFTEEAEAPGELLPSRRDLEAPWYSNNRVIGANTYLWRQEFGGERPPQPKPAGEIRVFVVGGSQAWGSGATSSRETFAELLERRLVRQGLPVRVYNAAVNGAGLPKIAVYYRQLLRHFQPDILLADVGLNDSAVLAATRSSARRARRAALQLEIFRGLLEDCRADGVDVLLCLEPMCMELPLRPDPVLYEGMEKLAQEFGATVVKPLEVTRAKEKDHLLWWDTAHFAPAGHHLMARLLEPALEEVVRRRLPGGS